MSLPDEIERLAALRDRGLLNEAEFAAGKARLLAGEPPGEPAAVVNRLRRSRSDRWVGGVCGGLARSLGAEAWVLRLLIVLLVLFGGTGVVIYLLLWIFVPSE
jgi:phage shock protein PspC (stress-responsive transcriptional regulator)